MTQNRRFTYYGRTRKPTIWEYISVYFRNIGYALIGSGQRATVWNWADGFKEDPNGDFEEVVIQGRYPYKIKHHD